MIIGVYTTHRYDNSQTLINLGHFEMLKTRFNANITYI